MEDFEIRVTFQYEQPTKKYKMDSIKQSIKEFQSKYCDLARSYQGFWIDQGWYAMEDDKNKARIVKHDIVLSFVTKEGMLSFKAQAESIKPQNVSLTII
tara:strand:- start:88 stop:384 length:297 start_codon:yes stop_codon:yes gene_type:complete